MSSLSESMPKVVVRLKLQSCNVGPASLLSMDRKYPLVHAALLPGPADVLSFATGKTPCNIGTGEAEACVAECRPC